MAESSTRTVERALDLLAVICDGDGLTLSESSRAVDLSPSTALRLLRTLETRGFVRRGEDGTYGPGGRIIQLGAQSLSSESLVTLSRTAMEDLVAETGESAYLSVEGHDRSSLYIAIVEGTHSVRHANWVGRTVPLERSAAGQVLTDQIPEAGYVVVERGVETDVTAIAAPIRSELRVVAALSLVVPSYRVTPADLARYGPLLARAADTVSAGLGKTTHAPADHVNPD
ncbi:IclR family transcriptional regulator [Cryobacterium algoritolerans]|uniref:IclR family transcriptional regulator n=1 Tax=Cryobacterium algoritolerans TaxID=1259184 RepID=A0A4R8WWQ1_9MICO|nr:IclR family transcriptional regulator [Cryobacterium algoritolerans]TFC19792.1 IclR family transcriptional regulator [Cryobacterium algoritolerans]